MVVQMYRKKNSSKILNYLSSNIAALCRNVVMNLRPGVEIFFAPPPTKPQ